MGNSDHIMMAGIAGTPPSQSGIDPGRARNEVNGFDADVEEVGVVPDQPDIWLDEDPDPDPELGRIMDHLDWQEEPDGDDFDAEMADQAQIFAEIELDFGEVPPADLDPGAFPYPWTAIPKHMRRSLAAYIRDRVDPGRTWRAILGGEWHRMDIRLDESERACLGNIAHFVGGYMPSTLYGSPARVQFWTNPRRFFRTRPRFMRR